MAIDPYKVWANMKLKTWPERYWMVDLFDEAAEAAARVLVSSTSRYSRVIRDQAGLSVIADEETVTSLVGRVGDSKGHGLELKYRHLRTNQEQTLVLEIVRINLNI